jgi:hypothetical protein
LLRDEKRRREATRRKRKQTSREGIHPSIRPADRSIRPRDVARTDGRGDARRAIAREDRRSRRDRIEPDAHLLRRLSRRGALVKPSEPLCRDAENGDGRSADASRATSRGARTEDGKTRGAETRKGSTTDARREQLTPHLTPRRRPGAGTSPRARSKRRCLFVGTKA